MLSKDVSGRRRRALRTFIAASGGVVITVGGWASTAAAQTIEVTPSSEGLPGGDLFQKIVNWAGQIGIWFVIAAFVIGSGAWALGGLSGNPQTAARGQKAIGVAVLAAILLGGAAAILNLFYQAGGTIS